MMVDLRHGSRTAAKRLGEGGPSPGAGPAPWPSRKAFRLRRGGGVAMPSFQFLVKSGKPMLMAVM